MIDFNKNSIFNLTPISIDSVRDDVTFLLVEGETIIDAFKTLRDQLVFTNKRIISVDSQFLSGKRKSYSSLPYSKIQFFAVQTPSFSGRPDKLFPTGELHLFFANGYSAEFDFKEKVDIIRLCKMISAYIL